MLCTLLGRKEYQGNFEGRSYSGVKLFLVHEDDHADGMICDIEKVSTSCPSYHKIMSIPVGSKVSPIYNRYGKIDDVILEVK